MEAGEIPLAGKEWRSKRGVMVRVLNDSAIVNDSLIFLSIHGFFLLTGGCLKLRTFTSLFIYLKTGLG